MKKKKLLNAISLLLISHLQVMSCQILQVGMYVNGTITAYGLRAISLYRCHVI